MMLQRSSELVQWSALETESIDPNPYFTHYYTGNLNDLSKLQFAHLENGGNSSSYFKSF